MSLTSCPSRHSVRQFPMQASHTHGFRRAYGWHPCAVAMLLRNVAGGNLPQNPQCAVVAHPVLPTRTLGLMDIAGSLDANARHGVHPSDSCSQRTCWRAVCPGRIDSDLWRWLVTRSVMCAALPRSSACKAHAPGNINRQKLVGTIDAHVHASTVLPARLVSSSRAPRETSMNSSRAP